MARPDQDTNQTTKPGMMKQVKEKVQHAFGSDEQGESSTSQGSSSMKETMEHVKEKVQHVFGNDQGDTGSADRTKGSMQETMAPGSGTHKKTSLDEKVIKHTK